MQSPKPPKPQQGFTLIELMVTIAVAAILLTIAVPSFQSTSARAQLTTQTNNFLAAIASARSEAIKNNTRAVLCASNNGSACNGTAWTEGWLVFVDANRNAALDAGEDVTTVSQAANSLIIQGTAPVATRLTFGSDGMLFGVNPAGTVRVCKATTALAVNENARDIIINITGRTNVQAPNPAIATVGACPAP